MSATRKQAPQNELGVPSLVPNVNDSVINDIEGTKFLSSFNTALWILLTSQKPQPVEVKTAAKAN